MLPAAVLQRSCYSDTDVRGRLTRRGIGSGEEADMPGVSAAVAAGKQETNFISVAEADNLSPNNSASLLRL